MTDNNSAGAVKCEICGQHPPKYKCPKCMLKTCSLPCVKQHKASQVCSGVRDKTTYIKIKEYSDLNLLNDYRFLEETGRKAESANRDPNNKRQHLPMKVQKLIQACDKRGIIFKHMPPAFSRRKENTSYYYIASDEIHWHVEWVFPQAGIKHSESIPENKSFKDALADFVDPNKASAALYHSLKMYRREHESKGVTFLMKVERRPANSVRYYKFDPSTTLKSCLKDKVVIEYPSIHVILGDSPKEYRLLGDDDSDSEESSSDSDSDTDSSSNSSESETENAMISTKSTLEPPWNKLLDENFGKS